MDRVYESGASVTPPTPPAIPSTGYPSKGNPAGGVMPTVPGPYMFHQLVEEIMAVISAAGIAADATVLTQLLTSLRSRGVVQQSKLNAVSASVAGNALTVGMQPCAMDIRNAALTNGTPNTRIIPAALSLTVPAGATLGTANATAARLALLAIDNAGTVELAIANTEGGLTFDETGLISTTAITNASNSASVVYSAAARANVPYRLVGYVDITEATAGTWATAPTVVQGNGGNAMPSGIASVLVGASFICIQLVGGVMIQAAFMVSSATADVTWTYPVAFKRKVFGVVGNQNNNPSASILVSAVPTNLVSCGLGSYVSNTGARSAATQIAAIAIGI